MKNKKYIICIISLIVILLLIVVVGFIKSKNKNYEIEKIENWNYFSLTKDEKMGVINKYGEIIINPEYKTVKIPNPEKGVFICENDDKKIVLNENNKEIFKNYEEVDCIELKELAIDIPFEKSVLKYKKDGKYGLINFEGKEITKNIYNSIENLPYKEGELLVKKDEHYGVINIAGKQVIPLEYDEINIDLYYEEENLYQNSGYILGKQSGSEMKYIYYNYKHEQEVEEQFDEIERINEIEDKDSKYLIVRKGDNYGILKNNNYLTDIIYTNIEYDKLNNLFIVNSNNKYGVLKNDGNLILSCIYDEINIEGIYIYATKDDKQNIFLNNGESIENAEFKSAYYTEDEKYKIVVDNNNNYGVIKNNNEKIIDNKYAYIGYLNNNNFIVSNEIGKNGVIDGNGKLILNLEYDIIENIDNMKLIIAIKSETNSINLYNENMEKLTEKSNYKLNDNYIKLYSDNDQVFYDKDGNEKQISQIYENNEIYPDIKNGKWGFVDKQGNIKIDYIYEDITEFNKYGYAGIKKDGKWGSINNKGEIISEPVYTLNNSEIDFIGKYYKFTYGYKKFYYTDKI